MEYVVLVNDQNEVLGTANKETVHNSKTPLHRAFSLFLFNPKKELLLQQRSRYKKTWPLIWSNSCCGHPSPNETVEEAIVRRLEFELGIKNAELHEILPDFRYCASQDGVMENEICPVWIGFTEETPLPNHQEVENTSWVNWTDFFQGKLEEFEPISPWCKKQIELLNKNNKFRSIII